MEIKDFPMANPEHVKMLLDYLLEQLNSFTDTHPEIDNLDLFMAVHNFHVITVLSLEHEKAENVRDQVLLRDMAVETFRLAMENKPAFKK